MNRNGASGENDPVLQALASDRAPLPEPLWPLIRDRLPRRVRRASWRVRVAFALGSLAAAVAGLIGGVEFGANLGLTTQTPQSTWTEVGSVLADGSNSTLDNVYLALGTQNGSEQK